METRKVTLKFDADEWLRIKTEYEEADILAPIEVWLEVLLNKQIREVAAKREGSDP